jgi:hypothetical protein
MCSSDVVFGHFKMNAQRKQKEDGHLVATDGFQSFLRAWHVSTECNICTEYYGCLYWVQVSVACALPRLSLAVLALLPVVFVTAAQGQLQGAIEAYAKGVDSTCNPTCPDGDLCCSANTNTSAGTCCAGKCLGDACCPYALPATLPPRLSLFAVDTPHCNVLTVTNTSSTCFLNYWDAHGYQYNGTFCLGQCPSIYVLNELQGASSKMIQWIRSPPNPLGPPSPPTSTQSPLRVPFIHAVLRLQK